MKKFLDIPSILIISDSITLIRWLKTNLKEDYYIIEDTDCTAALETTKSVNLDFIIID